MRPTRRAWVSCKHTDIAALGDAERSREYATEVMRLVRLAAELEVWPG